MVATSSSLSTSPPASHNGTLAHLGASEIFPQEDQKVRRFLGVRAPSAISRTTPSAHDRWAIVKPEFTDCSSEVIAACIEVHRELGPGLLEAIYEECLCDELQRRGISFERQKALAVAYKGRVLNQTYRSDLIVERELLVECKAVDSLLPVHVAQVVTYLRLSNLDAGLLVNFNSVTIRSGLRRVFRHPPTFCPSDLPVKTSPRARRGQ